MKKAMVYILALTLAFSAFLSGCGMDVTAKKEPTGTERPRNSEAPASMRPDPEDGVVKDDDGIITDDDTGDGKVDDEPIRGGDLPETGRGENDRPGGNGMTGSEGMDPAGDGAVKP